jgi:hypothetical protein
MSRLRTCGALPVLHNTSSQLDIDVQGQTTLLCLYGKRIRKSKYVTRDTNSMKKTRKELKRKERRVPPQRRLNFNWLHGVISQKIELFITMAMRASSRTRERTVGRKNYEIWIARKNLGVSTEKEQGKFVGQNKINVLTEQQYVLV